MLINSGLIVQGVTTEVRYFQNSFKYYLDQKVEIFLNCVIAE